MFYLLSFAGALTHSTQTIKNMKTKIFSKTKIQTWGDTTETFTLYSKKQVIRFTKILN
jgi:hypothetical protein